jgi:hypothetical protein
VTISQQYPFKPYRGNTSLSCKERSRVPRHIFPAMHPTLSILTNCSAMRKDRHVATARSQEGIARGTRTTSTLCFATRTKQWLARRRKHLGRDQLEVVLGAQARIHLHICKLSVFHRSVPTSEHRFVPHELLLASACTRIEVCRSSQG